jgi:hypothetical protein
VARKPERRIVDALDDLTAQLRLSNQIAVLRAGASLLEHDSGARASSPAAVARVAKRNALRAEVRAALELEEVADRG